MEKSTLYIVIINDSLTQVIKNFNLVLKSNVGIYKIYWFYIDENGNIEQPGPILSIKSFPNTQCSFSIDRPINNVTGIYLDEFLFDNPNDVKDQFLKNIINLIRDTFFHLQR